MTYPSTSFQEEQMFLKIQNVFYNKNIVSVLFIYYLRFLYRIYTKKVFSIIRNLQSMYVELVQYYYHEHN